MTRRLSGRIGLLATGAVATVLLVGCSGGQGSQASGQPAAPQQTTQPDRPSTATAVASGSQGGGRCHTGDLSAALGQKVTVPTDVQGQLGAAGTHYSITLIWTNKSTQTCTLHGFGGVDVDGPNMGSTGGPTYSLPRTGDSPATVTLRPGGHAITKINYIDPSGSAPGPYWTPTHLSVTPPDETTQLTVPWTAGTPVYQDPQDGMAAASISPVTSGA